MGRFGPKTARRKNVYGLGLCAGSGMLDESVRLAFEYGGVEYKTVAYCERDMRAASRLISRMEDGCLERAHVCDSFEDIDESFRGVIDCIVAGIPCQSNSLAGKRKLEADERNLWPATRKLLRRVEPKIFFLENVAGILVPNRKRKMPSPCLRILGELSEMGFNAEWATVSARSCGANIKKRERWFCLAVSESHGLPWRKSCGLVTVSGVAGGSRPMACPSSARSQGAGPEKKKNSRPVAGAGGGMRPLFAPGKNREIWNIIFEESPHLYPAIEPGLRCVVDGLALVVDEDRAAAIRLCGNGVVASQAAFAFTALARRLGAWPARWHF